MTKRILFAGGGTGGHIYPALNLADAFKKRGFECEFVGTKDKIEAQLVPKRNYKIHFIWISGFHRSLRISNVLFPIKVLISLIQSWRILKRVKADLVIGTGGYVSGPVLFMARKLAIPTLIQEQNSYPGVTTRLLEEKVDAVHISYNYSRQFLKNKQAQLSGNPIPVRLNKGSQEDALKEFSLESKLTIGVMGGSLGALTINRAIKKITEKTNYFDAANLIWQTGKTSFEEFKDTKIAQGLIQAYFDDMAYFYAACDIIICRAGAISLSELAIAEKAAIIIPYKYAAANHQYFNAKAFEKENAAFLIEDNADLYHQLAQKLKQLIDDESLREKMRQNMKKIARPNAISDIVESGLKLIK